MSRNAVLRLAEAIRLKKAGHAANPVDEAMPYHLILRQSDGVPAAALAAPKRSKNGSADKPTT